MPDKEIVAYVSIALTVAMTISYLWKTHRGYIKPHIFTWIIWVTTTGISASARGVAHAGPGTWGEWAIAASCLSIALFAYAKGDWNVTRSDKIVFVGALAAIPAWLIIKDPLVAVVIVTAIDLAGYYSTFRKSYAAPHHEAVFNYVIGNILYLLSLIATAEYSLTTTLSPITFIITNTLLIGFIGWRRRCVPLVET